MGKSTPHAQCESLYVKYQWLFVTKTRPKPEILTAPPPKHQTPNKNNNPKLQKRIRLGQMVWLPDVDHELCTVLYLYVYE